MKATRVKRRWTVEHPWTCSACRHTNRGRDLTCPKCGKTKSDERYDESSKTTVTDEALVSMAHAGPNWDCAFCRFENRATSKMCVQCGADRARDPGVNEHWWAVPETRVPTAVYPEAPKVEPEIPKIVVPEEPEPEPERTAAAPGGYRDAPVTRRDDEPPRDAPDESDRTSFDNRTRATWQEPTPPRWQPPAHAFKYLVGILAFAGVVALLVWLFSPWHEHVRITTATWARTSELQHRATLSGAGWGSPIGAFNVSCERLQHGTHDCNPYDCDPHSVECRCHDVPDGESCTEECTSGENGFSDCEEVCETSYREECDTCTEYDTCYEQCPTYDNWCRYNYYEWQHVETHRAGGTDHDTVTWPTFAIPQDGETYRELHDEQYSVTFTNHDGTWTTAPADQPHFARYHSGARWDIEVTHAGTVTPVREETQ